MNQPTVYLVIDESAIAFDQRGEIVETVAWNQTNGEPIWSEAAICDPRGAGGHEGFGLLAQALQAAERNAELVGFEVERAPVAP